MSKCAFCHSGVEFFYIIRTSKKCSASIVRTRVAEAGVRLWGVAEPVRGVFGEIAGGAEEASFDDPGRLSAPEIQPADCAAGD